MHAISLFVFLVLFRISTFAVPIVESNTKEEANSQLIAALKLAKEAGAPGLMWSNSLNQFYAKATEAQLSPFDLFKKKSWIDRLGLQPKPFLATYYIANPFILLPAELRQAIKDLDRPFKTRSEVWQWLKDQGSPDGWKQHLKRALRETTPWNLWRASRGLKPFTKSGKKLRPLIVHEKSGEFHLKDNGDVATDPNFIPTNSTVLVLLEHKGSLEIVKARAADTGSGVKGAHVDIPIYIKPAAAPVYHTNNSPALSRRTVTILVPMSTGDYIQKQIQSWSTLMRSVLYLFLVLLGLSF